MKKVLFIIFIIIGIITSGCVENTPSKTSPEVTITVPELPTIVSGINKVMEVSGKEIVISGTNNQVKILNENVSKIVLSGNNNHVLYKKEANPEIIDSGLGNEIKTY